MRNAYKMLFRKREGMRILGRLRRRSEYDIKMDFKIQDGRVVVH
jgi:hypothetical protein